MAEIEANTIIQRNERKGEAVKALKAAFPPALPVITGFIFPGLAYGVLMRLNGYGPLWSFLMSLLAFSGSFQYAAVPLMAAPFNPLGAALLALTINARHIFYGISMLGKYSGAGKLKPLLIHLLCDETYSVINGTETPDGVNSTLFYLFIGLFNYASWTLSSLAGGILGALVPSDTQGFDFIQTALFATIFLSWWDKPKCRTPALIGAFVTVVCRMIFGADSFLLPALFALIVILVALRKLLDRGAK